MSWSQGGVGRCPGPGGVDVLVPWGGVGRCPGPGGGVGRCPGPGGG